MDPLGGGEDQARLRRRGDHAASRRRTRASRSRRPGTRRPRSTPRSRRRCAPARRRTSSTPSRTRSSTWRTASCSISPTSTGRTSSRGRRRPGATRASPTACRSRPGPSSSTTTRRLMDELGVKRAGQRAALAGRLPRHGQEGEGQGHRRRWRSASATGPIPGAHLMHEALLQEARRRRLRQAAQRASSPGPTRASSTR